MVQKKKRGRKSKLIFGVAYMITGFFLIYTLFSNAMSVFQEKEEIPILEKQKETLTKEKKEIEKENGLLNDEDYITRYARENYIFTREGERVSIIPSDE